MKKHEKPSRFVEILFTLFSFTLVILIWYISSQSVAGAIIASPMDTFSAFVTELSNGQLIRHLGISLFRIGSGFVLAFCMAVPIAFLMGWYFPVKMLLEPIIQFIRNIPALAYIPLVVVAQGVGESAKITVIFIAAFLTMVIIIYQGVRMVDSTLIKAAYVLGADDRDIFVKVVVPASIPYIFVAIRQGLSASLTTLIAAELTGANAGIGQMIQEASLYFRMDFVMLGIIVIGVTGTILYTTVEQIERRLTVWQEKAKE